MSGRQPTPDAAGRWDFLLATARDVLYRLRSHDRPRGGVVTQRSAKPCTPVQFRAWPPTPIRQFRKPRAGTARSEAPARLRSGASIPYPGSAEDELRRHAWNNCCYAISTDEI